MIVARMSSVQGQAARGTRRRARRDACDRWAGAGARMMLGGEASPSGAMPALTAVRRMPRRALQMRRRAVRCARVHGTAARDARRAASGAVCCQNGTRAEKRSRTEDERAASRRRREPQTAAAMQRETLSRVTARGGCCVRSGSHRRLLCACSPSAQRGPLHAWASAPSLSASLSLSLLPPHHLLRAPLRYSPPPPAPASRVPASPCGRRVTRLLAARAFDFVPLAAEPSRRRREPRAACASRCCASLCFLPLRALLAARVCRASASPLACPQPPLPSSPRPLHLSLNGPLTGRPTAAAALLQLQPRSRCSAARAWPVLLLPASRALCRLGPLLGGSASSSPSAAHLSALCALGIRLRAPAAESRTTRIAAPADPLSRPPRLCVTTTLSPRQHSAP
jgi:hypothetical protein